MPLPREAGQVESQIASNRESYDQQVHNVQSNERLTEEAKNETVDQLTEEAQSRHLALWDRLAQIREEHKAQLRRDTFGPPIPLGLIPSQEQDVRRQFGESQDKAERAASEGGYSTLMKLYERDAVLGGDKIAAAAYFTVAREYGFGEVVDLYLSERPNEQARLEELEQLEAEDRDPFYGMHLHGPLRPSNDSGFARMADAMRRRR